MIIQENFNLISINLILLILVKQLNKFFYLKDIDLIDILCDRRIALLVLSAAIRVNWLLED